MEHQNIYKTLLLLTIFYINYSLLQKEPHYMYNRTTMVHLFEWKFDDIALECERFLGPYGYGGLQTSPITENIIIRDVKVGRPWWERYQTISYKFITRSGNEKQFQNMVKKCNSAGVRVFVDVILNHMAGNYEGIVIGTGGSTANPSQKHYPDVPYDNSHFHKSCSLNNFNSKYEMRNCQLLGLHDLDQSKEYVRNKLVDKLNRMINAGVAGFRIDAAKHISPEELKNIYNRLHNLRTDYGFPKSSRPFVVQEVPDLGGYGNVITREEYVPIGTVTEFRYGKELTDHIQGNKKLKYLKTFGTSWGLMETKDSLVFVDNHDTQRDGKMLNHKDSKKYKMAVAFMLAHPHSKLPRVMSSFEFNNNEVGPPQDENENILSPIINTDNSCANGWICEHRWRQIYNMVKFKNIVGDAPLTNWWDNGNNQIAFCRGNKGFISINKYGDLKQSLQTCLPKGNYCDIISGNVENNRCTGKTIIVDNYGIGLIQLHGLELDGVLAIHIDSKAFGNIG